MSRTLSQALPHGTRIPIPLERKFAGNTLRTPIGDEVFDVGGLDVGEHPVPETIQERPDAPVDAARERELLRNRVAADVLNTLAGVRAAWPMERGLPTGRMPGLSYQPNVEPYRWLSVPRWYLWDSGFLLTARAQGVVPSHAHHAIQIVIALDGGRAICGKDDEWRESRGIVVRADAEHSFDCNGALGVMLFVDPESREGVWVSASLRPDITSSPDTRLPARERRPGGEPVMHADPGLLAAMGSVCTMLALALAWCLAGAARSATPLEKS